MGDRLARIVNGRLSRFMLVRSNGVVSDRLGRLMPGRPTGSMLGCLARPVSDRRSIGMLAWLNRPMFGRLTVSMLALLSGGMTRKFLGVGGRSRRCQQMVGRYGDERDDGKRSYHGVTPVCAAA